MATKKEKWKPRKLIGQICKKTQIGWIDYKNKIIIKVENCWYTVESEKYYYFCLKCKKIRIYFNWRKLVFFISKIFWKWQIFYRILHKMLKKVVFCLFPLLSNLNTYFFSFLVSTLVLFFIFVIFHKHGFHTN